MEIPVEVTLQEAETCLSPGTLEEIGQEADRLRGLIVDLINYSTEIRVSDREGRRVSLQDLEPEEAEDLFRCLLEEETASGLLTAIKVRRGKKAETLFNFLKKHLRLKIAQEEVREIGRRVCRLEERHPDPKDGGRRAGRRPGPSLLIGGLKADIRDKQEIGKALVLAQAAEKVCRTSKILHACAARYDLEGADRILTLYDSIRDASLAHVPDLFAEARKIRRHFVIHVGGTNTGKTYDAMKALAGASSGVYLCPLRMLAYEGRAVVEGYGVPCSFATGEEKEIEPGARHVAETIGMLDYSRHYQMAVIDECQLISGEDGALYTNAILGVCADLVHVCCAWSGLDITKKLISLCGDDYEVMEHHRSSELKFEEEPYRGPRRYDAYIVFSRLGAYEMALWLEKRGMHPSIVYGKLPYEVKMEEARKFERGDTDCLVATDAIAIGQNYNIERIIFRDTVKFINRKEVELDSQTVKQVAGRAGRYGHFPVGYVNTFEEKDREGIRKKLEAEDQPSGTAPLELPEFLVETDLPLSLIYKAWDEAKVGAPFIKANTETERCLCRLIENRYDRIGKREEYILASLPLDLKDRDQEDLLDDLLYLYNRKDGTDEEWKMLLPGQNAIGDLVRYRPHLMTLEKLCRQLDLASSFFYKIRREDLARYVIRLKGPITERIAQIMGEKAKDFAGTGGTGSSEDTSAWPTAYIYVTVSGVCERRTGRFPYGDYRRLPSADLVQSFGNEATYIDYACYKRKGRTPDACRFEPYIRYTVKLDPAYIVSDEGDHFLAEKFRVLNRDDQHSASPMDLQTAQGGRGGRHKERGGRHGERGGHRGHRRH